MDTHFADTTIVYYTLHHHSLFKAAVKEAVGNGILTVSNFVRGEYIRGYITGLIEMYFAIEAEQSVEDGIVYFTGLMSTRNPRAITNAFQCASNWLMGFEDPTNVKKSLRRLGEHIRNALMKFDATFTRRSRDQTDCEFGIMSFPSESYRDSHILDFYRECDAITAGPKCSQCSFRKEISETLEKDNIELDSDAHKATFAKYSGYLKQAGWVGKARKTKKTKATCWYCDRLGDTIIVLSSPKDLTILSGDGQSFPPLASILNKPLTLIPSLEKLRKERDEK